MIFAVVVSFLTRVFLSFSYDFAGCRRSQASRRERDMCIEIETETVRERDSWVDRIKGR